MRVLVTGSSGHVGGAVVHAAAALPGARYAAALTLTNCLGTQQIVELAERWEVRSLVNISSVPVVGRPAELPVTEQNRPDPRTTGAPDPENGGRWEVSIEAVAAELRCTATVDA